MKKIRFLMMLALLVVGVSNALSATRTFTVQIVGLTAADGAGFTADTDVFTYTYNSRQYTANVQSYNQNSLTVYGNVNRNFDYHTSYYLAELITNHIKANQVKGYHATITANTTTITITYSNIYGKQYNVVYVGLPNGVSGDYQVNTPWTETNYYATIDDVRHFIYIEYNKVRSDLLTLATYLENYPSNGEYYQYTYDDDDMYQNPEWYVTPKPIDGYDATVTSSSSTITITYSPTTAIKWHDDIFEYSTRHTQSTGNVQNLPPGEVSISLWMGRNETQFETITDIVNYDAPLWWGAAVNDEQELTDYGNTEDITAKATYKYLGKLPNYTPGSGSYFYERTHRVPISTVQNVVIPNEKEYNGTIYKVTAIQKWGFCYRASDCNPRYVCEEDQYDQWKGKEEDYLITEKLAEYDYGNINDHRNDYLVSVRFESPSNVTQIGDYAFMSNKVLESIIIPSSVEDLGQGIWECCQALTDLRFQTTTITKDGKTYEGVKFDKIKNFTFWYCTALQTLILPDGITEIEGTAIGAPLQYMFSLIDLKLPNTLEKIGPHFVCCCTSLETLTIPASVEEIAGACFHGCESLTSVYLLGGAGVLQAAAGEGDNTFGENLVFCKDHVSGCTFYTTTDFVDTYAANDVWSEIADNVDSQGYLIDEDGNRIKDKDENEVTPGKGEGYGNSLMVLTGEKREFVDGKWITCCFPQTVVNYKDDNKFGSKAIAAVMLEGEEYTYAVNGNPYYYHVAFKEIDGNDIPADTPVLLLPRHATSHNTIMEMMPDIHMLTEEQKANMTVAHTTSVNAYIDENSNKTATIKMIGKYIRQRMNPGDFYFVSSGQVTPEGGDPVEIGQFKKVVEQTKAPYINAFRCYWQVDVDGVTDISSSPLSMLFHAKRNDSIVSEDGGFVDGINQTEKDVKIVVDIYDVNGRKIDVQQETLPKGLFIVNGKKVVVK